MRIFLNVVISIVVIILIITVLVVCFINFWKPFGDNPTKEDKQVYKRAANYDFETGKFLNESEYKLIGNSGENNFVSTKNTTAKEMIKAETPNLKQNLMPDDFNVTWFGHSTVFLQMHGMNILIDPIFSDYASPVQFAGPKRFSEIPMTIEELPEIDIVIISHDHYDHLDYNSIIDLKDKTKQFIVPLGVENHLEAWGVEKTRITAMAWWEETTVNNLLIACTPGRHNSFRLPQNRFATLWSSFVLIDEYNKVFYTGDTGFGEHFKDIYEKYGTFDLALLECGQYDISWKFSHMVPEESVEVGKILAAKTIMPIHWGTFSISNHGWDDPVIRFVQKAKEENIKYAVPKIGETFKLEDEKIEEWWMTLD